MTTDDLENSISDQPNYNPCYSAYRQTLCNNRFLAMARMLRNLLLRFEDEDAENKLTALNDLISAAQNIKKELEEKINAKNER